MGSRPKRQVPLEHRLLQTATLCLLAVGALMVYSASSAESLLAGSGDPSYYLKRYLIWGALGLLAMRALSRMPMKAVKRLTPVVLLAGFVLTLLVMVPPFGVTVNGAKRWLGFGPVQFQPSELLKVGLVVFCALALANRPRMVESVRGLTRPLLLIVGAACVVLMLQPDMGTTMVICFTVGCLLVAAGTPMRKLGMIAGSLAALALVFALIEPYRRARLTAFLDPWADAGGDGFQSVQAMIAIGSGGPFGVGLGESVQKVFYLPEAHTDMILAIIGEEVGFFGIGLVAVLYGIIGFAGLRAARLARDRHAKLLAAGLVSLILCQATLNFFAVMGLAPLTGVPLPFISYGNSSMVVLLGAMGILMNVASGPRVLTAIEGRGGERAEDRDRGRRHGGTRGAGPGRRRRAAG